MKWMMTVKGGFVLTTLIAIGRASAQQANAGNIHVKDSDEAAFAEMAKI